MNTYQVSSRRILQKRLKYYHYQYGAQPLGTREKNAKILTFERDSYLQQENSQKEQKKIFLSLKLIIKIPPLSLLSYIRNELHLIKNV